MKKEEDKLDSMSVYVHRDDCAYMTMCIMLYMIEC